MNKKQEQLLSDLIEEIDELALSVGNDTSRTELLEHIDKMMWKVTWAVDDVYDAEEELSESELDELVDVLV